MPWSPIPKFPRVLEILGFKGYKLRARAQDLRIAIITTLDAASEKTIRRDISLMIEIGWIISYDGGVIYELSQGGIPNNFPPRKVVPIEPEPDVVPEEKAEEHLDALLPES